MRVLALYDIHGNVDALDAVLADPQAADPDIALFDTASQAQGLTRRWVLEDMHAPAPYRLYRATVSQHWVLDPDSSPDDRAEVTL